MPDSVWRRVRARVHLSLTPSELSNPVRAATNRAFSSLLMRYSPELGGAVVAHIGPLQLSGPPLFVGASPFPHVVAIANLLVFAPTKGSQLLGVVTHVGPDHLGLSVLSAFHAVLPIDDLSHMYCFNTDFAASTPTPFWKHLNGQDKITVNRQIRFVVSDVKPTRSGLFQIIASLDHTLRDQPDDAHPLGLLPPEKQILLSARSRQSHSDDVEPSNTDLPEIGKRNMEDPTNQTLTGDDLLMSGNDGFGDALMPMAMPPAPSPKTARKRKKSRVDGVEHGWSGIRESGRGTSQKSMGKDSRATESHYNESAAKTPRKKVRSGDADGEGKQTPDSHEDERSERKKRRREKKKNKKNRMSQSEGELLTFEGDERAQGKRDSASGFNKDDEIKQGEVENGDKKHGTIKQEAQALEETNDREIGHNGDDLVQSGKKDGKKKKKKKKKRKEIQDSNDGEAHLHRRVGNMGNGKHVGGSERVAEESDKITRRHDDGGDDGSRLMKAEEKDISGDETAVKTEMMMMRAEERTAEASAPGGEINTEDGNRVANTAERGAKDKKKQRDDGDHRKMKKKRKRSSEGEVDSGMKRKKKKHKKRLSLGSDSQ